MTNLARIGSLSSCVLAAAVLLGGCGDDDDSQSADAGAPDGGAQSGAARGQYLAEHLSLCIDCHTPRNADGSFDRSRLMAGVECLIDVDPAAGQGCLNSKNLTPDPTGLKNLSDAQIKEMFQNGITPTGTALIPVMPYWVFHNMNDDDADAIVAYLRSLPAISHAVPPSEAPWTAPPVPATPIDPATIPAAPQGDDSAARGRYLASMAGVCIECHTPQLPPGGERPADMSRPFAGGRDFQPGFPSPPFPPHIFSRNLTEDATGLAGWTAADVVKVIEHGIDRNGGKICPPMPSGPTGQFGGLTDADVMDIANYIIALPAIHNEIPNECVAP